ncbi:ABC transporter ATP-binding protein (plasmid) [Pseudonocardia alaniniphila]|uniref:ABC transporter ATP-binding protein n=2 Tax=Pseudonocardia alaniniphila TaxID=75291 RepID=A0ABS9T7K0_9PSEU|nr:ABC transporter ATP-binding protein [Pseudonocardia alaniniphila]MCH6164495.1 ABC transporter ATP-binding protein [Pseudonocardia alaniniphila]
MADLTFTVGEREFVCIVGSSGCGKTTMLRCLSGLVAPTSGTVTLDGTPVDGPPKDMAFVFQDYSRSLLPWMTVAGNVSFPLSYKGLSKAQAAAATAEALAAVGLGDRGDSYPWQLSGGMQQRVAIARALAYQPRILLMDEPFASVDAQTRADLEDLLLDIWRRYDITVLFVTHDIDEAVYLSQRVLVLRRPAHVHEIVEVDLPAERDQLATKQLPRFGELRSHVLSSLRSPQAADTPSVLPG